MDNDRIAQLVETNPVGGFRLQCRSIFLTYAQCPLSPEVLLKELQSITNITCYSIGQENHQDDSGLHLHVFLQFPRKLDIKSSRFFDVLNYHPHLQLPRNKTAVIEYTQKDGKFISDIEVRSTYQSIFKKAQSKMDFLSLVKSSFPRDFALNLQRLEYCANVLYPEDTEEDFQSEYSKFNVPNLLTDWLRSEVLNSYDFCEACDNIKTVPIPSWISFNCLLPQLDSFYNFYIAV